MNVQKNGGHGGCQGNVGASHEAGIGHRQTQMESVINTLGVNKKGQPEYAIACNGINWGFVSKLDKTQLEGEISEFCRSGKTRLIFDNKQRRSINTIEKHIVKIMKFETHPPENQAEGVGLAKPAHSQPANGALPRVGLAKPARSQPDICPRQYQEGVTNYTRRTDGENSTQAHEDEAVRGAAGQPRPEGLRRPNMPGPVQPWNHERRFEKRESYRREENETKPKKKSSQEA